MRSKEFLTAAEVSGELRCSTATVRRILARGQLRAKRVNKRRFLYTADSFVAYMSSLPDHGT